MLGTNHTFAVHPRSFAQHVTCPVTDKAVTLLPKGHLTPVWLLTRWPWAVGPWMRE